MSKKKKTKIKKPRKPSVIFEVMAIVRSEKHKSDKRETSKRRKNKEREEILEGL